jgi:hypothetical protein
MSTWVAAVIALASITATYLSCVRPALRGRCAASASGADPEGHELDHQLADLREEVRILRAQHNLSANQSPPGAPGPAR